MEPSPSVKYHDIIKTNPELSVDSYQKLIGGMNKERLLYKNDTIPVLIQPYFIDQNFINSLKKITRPVEKGLNRIIDIALGHPDSEFPTSADRHLVIEIKDAFALSETEYDLARLNCGTNKHILIYRLDLYSGKKYSILEFNTDSAAGILETDIQIKLFTSLPSLLQLTEDFSFRQTDGARGILDALLNSDYPGKSTGEDPTICLTDWSDVGTKSEQENLVKYFRQLGYKALLADPREFTYRNKALHFKGEKIHIIHRRVIASELADHISEVQPLIQAITDRAVSVINPFSSALGSNKVILAILSDDRFHPLLDDDTVEIMNQFLPWTRQLHGDSDPALLDEVLNNKDSYVLKKGKSYGGSSVIVGREINRDQWKMQTDEILNSQRDRWIVQKYVPPPKETYPVIRENTLEFHELIFNINPFIIDGEYVNGMARLNFPDRQVINVARGGYQIPMLQTDAR